MSGPALDATARAAIGWMVLLQSGEASPEERQDFDAWLRRDARHRAAWQHLAGPVAGLFEPLHQQLPGRGHAMADAMSDAKTRLQRRRRVLKGALAVAGVGAGTASVLQRFEPLQSRFADLRTVTGERRRFALADGSSLLLDARSAADVHFTASRREVRLRLGAVIAEVQPDRERPFCVTGAQGEVRPVDNGTRTRFLLRQQDQACLVAALDGALQIAPANAASLQLPAGAAVWLTAGGAVPAAGSAASAAAWEGGRVAVYDRPLGEVVDALRAYRTGFVRISPAAAALKVYGSYPLDDTDAALASIAETLPVAVHVHSAGWLVRIELA